MSLSQDKRELITILKLIKKYNLKQTEGLLRKEANIKDDIVVDDADLSNILVGDLDGEHAPASGSGGDQELYEIAFNDLRNFVEESLDIYKHELSLVLYPILVQIYLKLVQTGNEIQARKFVEKYGPGLDDYYQEDLQNILLITKPSQMENNDLVTAMEQDKFIIRMSRDSHSLFKRHIQDRKLEILSQIVSKYLLIDTYEGTARSKAQCDATAGAIIGEARRQDNKVRVFFGLLKEVDFQSLTTTTTNPPAEEEDENDPDAPDRPKKKKPKKDPLFSKKSKSDPNAPAHDRIPLPELKDADKLEKLKALRESSKRVILGKDSFPSVCFYTILNGANSVTCAEISEDSSMVAVGFTDSSIKVWSLTPAKLREMKTAEQLKDIDKDAEDVLVRMMDDRTAETSRTFFGHSGPVYRCAFAPEKNLLLSCSEDTTIRLWSLHTWTCVVVYKGHLYPVWDVRFSPHGYYFATCSYDKSARLWATDCNQPLRIFCGHLADVDCVQFHPNSNYIATGSSDRTVRLWDVLNGQLVRLMTGHKGPVYSLAFSICGRYLASGSSDHQVLIWDITHGQLVASLSKHTGSIHTMSFSRDGNILAVGGLDCYLTLWDFSKLTEDYQLANSGHHASHNPDINDGTEYLLRAFPTKSSPFLTLHFTRRNLLLAVGVFKAQ
ncbi:transcription initiation factor TFIID subunit 5 [Eupeodes corollae]|uniref:transcription initiation factor TFIID subunit 5 n=1 Tax=Eupeodes corollae TaxID=290404 RepID=UPI002491C1A2|nr:transcription initiation factor TFIID subunit 5 [Eupeodes corollae]